MLKTFERPLIEFVLKIHLDVHLIPEIAQPLLSNTITLGPELFQSPNLSQPCMKS
jgi:hypothetical protein